MQSRIPAYRGTSLANSLGLAQLERAGPKPVDAQQEAVASGIRGMYWPLPGPDLQQRPDWRDLVWLHLAWLALVGNPLLVDPRTASAALRSSAWRRPRTAPRHQHSPRDLDGQRDEPAGSTRRAGPWYRRFRVGPLRLDCGRPTTTNVGAPPANRRCSPDSLYWWLEQAARPCRCIGVPLT